jgi:hypothetical protein
MAFLVSQQRQSRTTANCKAPLIARRDVAFCKAEALVTAQQNGPMSHSQEAATGW